MAGNISIHAPAKGATKSVSKQSQNEKYFNPRSREGSDLTNGRTYNHTIYFNPRSREGSDGQKQYHPARSKNFNPRSREGSDDYRRGGSARPAYFNPRSREGSDTGLIAVGRDRTLFQSTLPRRERRYALVESDSMSVISIHAPAKGATGCL